MPVVFKDLGKGAKDLLSKKYDFKNEIKTVNKAERGLTIEAAGCGCKSGIAGSAKVTYKDSSFGELEKELKTCGAVSGKVKLTKLVDNATITINGNNKNYYKLETDYKTDAFTTQFDVDTNLASALAISTNLVDGLAVGCNANFDFSNGADLKDYNFGAQYAFSRDVTLSCVTAKGRSTANIGVLHKLSGGDSYALGMNLNTSTYASSMCVGVEKKVDSNMTVKAKLGSCGGLSTAVEHKLADPKMKINIAAEFDATSPDLTARKFGVGLVFGDY